MKKWMLLLSILVLLSASLIAVNVIPVGSRNDVSLVTSSTTSLTLHYDVDKIESTDMITKGGTFSSLNIAGYTSTSDFGTPALPLNRKLIAVPLGATVDFQILNSTFHEYGLQAAGINYPIMPAQESVDKCADPATIPFAYKSAAYLLSRYTDKPLFHVEEIGILRGVRMFAVDFEPVQYNPATQQIKVWNSADIQVTFRNGDLYATEQMRLKTYSPAFEGAYAKSLMNYAEVNNRATNLRYPLGYLIITTPALSATMSSFVTWKKQQGYKVTLATTATTGTTTTAIKAYIQNIWTNATVANPAPSFLLIVGDTSDIPAWTGTAATTHITDLDYVKLNGTDYVPDMYFGRFSASTTTDLQNIIDKTLMYEKTTMPSTAYLGNVDMIAGQDATYGLDYGDGQIRYGINNFFNAAHGITSSTYLYAVSGSSDAQIIADVSAGRGYVNYTAHGSETGWADPTFSISDIAGLTNTNKYPVMVGNCCLTNHFDTAVCFGEALIRAANKGAVAYIGGTDNSYWDEDYWWGVGAKYTTAQITAANGVPPAWSAGKIGVYDGLFHEHSEATADWVTSLGAMNLMGNLAVVQGASVRIPYYWEIYSIMGDPSLTPYLGVPTVNNVTAPATVLIGATSYTVTAAANSYVCLSMGGTIYGTGTVDGTGSLTMTITPFAAVGTADLVVTGQNKVTNIRTVSIVPATGAYVSVEANAYADANNNVAEYNETGRFNTTFKNVGTVTATNTVTTLSTSASGITITDNTESIASLAAGASTTINSAYTFTTDNNIVDQTSVPFHIAMVNGANTWTYDFNTIINAPALALGNITVSDPTGNNNGRIDPGETVTISMPLNNTGHASTVAGTVTMASPTTGVTVTSGTYSAAAIAASGSATATFTMTVAGTVAVGSVITLNFNATAGAYTASKTESPAVGIVSETFETGNLSAFAWTTVGTPAWSVVNTGAHLGTYAAKSGAITHSQTIDLKVTMNITTAGNITFYKMVSSESGYDFLKFYIDATETGSWSGLETAYAQVTYPVTTGSHTFKWTYLKDSSVDGGSNCAWIDDIVFPPTSGSVVTYDPPQNLTAVAKNGAVTLNWTAPATGTPASYKIYRGGVQVASSITGLTYTNTGLTNGTSYSFYATAVYTTLSAGESVASNTVSSTPIAAVPTGLVATAGNTLVNLSWTAPTAETPNGYNVYRNSVKITATPITTTTYSNTGLTNGTTYTYYVTSVFTTPAAESAASTTASATPSTASTVTIGTGTTLYSRYPLSTYYGYERQASLFLSSEIATTGNIQTLSWWPTITTTASIPVKIYIKTQTATTLTAATWATMISGATTVFNGTVAGLTAGAWKTIDITDYAYTSNNLIIMVECNYAGSGTGASAGAAFRYTASAANMVASWATDTTAPTGNGTLGTSRPNIQMAMGTITSNPVFSVSPASLAYGNTIINTTSATQTLTVTNTGGGTLTINSTAKTGTDAASYTLTDTNTYPKALASGASMTVTVVFAPTTIGAKTAAIRFTDTLARATHDVALTGTGYDPTVTIPFAESFDSASFPPTGWLNQAISPNTALFDYQTAGTYPTCVPHTGAGMVRYSSFTIQAGISAMLATPPMQFVNGVNYRTKLWFYRDASTSYATNADLIEIYFNTSQSLTGATLLGTLNRSTTLAPVVATAGWYEYSFDLPVNQGANLRYVIIKGTSQYGDNMFIDDFSVEALVLAPIFGMSPASLDFGTITTGQTITRNFTINNTGTASLTGNITTPAGYSVAQSVRTEKSAINNGRNTLPYTIAASGTGTFTVTFAPVIGQTYAGSIGITSNDTNHLTNSLPVTGIGATPPEISVNPTALIKDLFADATGSDIITVSNAGGMPLNYTVVLQSARNVARPSSDVNRNTDWLSVTPSSGSVAGSSSADLTVGYDATGLVAGTYNAVIQINSNDTTAPTKEVTVTLNVAFVNHAPTITLPAAWNFDKGTTLVKDFTAYINDVDSDPISITYSGNTNVQVLVNVHSVTFSASANWVGTENITFTADDGQGGTNSDVIAITVNPVNTPVWTPVVYPNNSATVYSLVTIDGLPAVAGDIVGAFVNGECRGTGTVVSDRNTYVTMLINVAQNGETVNFKLYHAAADVLYDALNTITVNIGETQGGPGNYVPVEVITAPVVVDAPINVQIQPQSSNFAISWPAVVNANTYHVYRSTTPNGTYTKIGTVHTNSYIDMDLSSSMYFYYVTAENIVTK